MFGTVEEMLGTLISKIEKLETRLEKQEQEITRLNQTVEYLSSQLTTKQNGSSSGNPPISKVAKPTPLTDGRKAGNNNTRRNFLARLAATGLVAFGTGVVGVATEQKEVKARILVNPTQYPLQFGAITTPQSTTISGQLQDTNVRIGLAACGDPAMDYSSLPLFDTGLYAQGAGYGIYAATDKSMGIGGYFRNLAPLGVGLGYALSAVSNNGTGIYGEGNNTSSGVSGNALGSGSGVNGSSFGGTGVTGFSNAGVALKGTTDTGVPLRLTTSSSTPTSGTRVRGDVYLDNLGKMFIWARNDANSSDVWRQVQFVPA